MKLTKALKLKNKFAGEINKLQRLIQDENVQMDDNKSSFQVKNLFEKLNTKQHALATLKGKIAVANGPIFEKIFLMAELKNQISFLEGLNTKEGSFMESRFLSADSVKATIYKAEITKHFVENQIEVLKNKIEELQDEIDEFNTITYI